MEQAEKKFSKTIFSGAGGSSNRRRVNHYNQQKPRFVNEIPTQESGVEGDIVYYNPFLYNRPYEELIFLNLILYQTHQYNLCSV